MSEGPSGDLQQVQQECLTCRLNQGALPVPGGAIYRDTLWCLEHNCEPIALLGWLVLKPMRHVEAFADLTLEEATAFGPLTHLITRAMTDILHPEKIYVSMYMEAPGFAHLHVHLIPRFAETPPERRGPAIFEYLRESKKTGQNRGTIAEAEQIAAAIRQRITERQEAQNISINDRRKST